MLRITRGLHTSKRLLQETTTVAAESAESALLSTPKSEGVERVEAWLKYAKLPRTLRILMYRKRHAQELLSRDLLDPHTDKRARPQEFLGLPSNAHLREFIHNAKTPEDLKQIQKDLSLLQKKGNGLTPYALNELAIKAAELRCLQNFIPFLHKSKETFKLKNSSNLNMAIFFNYLNPNRTYKNALSKLATAKKFIRHEDSITNLLSCAIYSKYKKQVVPKELYSKVKEDTLELPFEKFEKSIGHQNSLVSDNEHLYLTLKPVAIELGEHKNFKDLPNVKKVVEFVTKYEEVTKKLGKENRFDQVKANSKFFKLIKTKENSEAAAPEA